MTNAMNRRDAVEAADRSLTLGVAENIVETLGSAECDIGYEAADPALFVREWPELPDTDVAARRLR